MYNILCWHVGIKCLLHSRLITPREHTQHMWKWIVLSWLGISNGNSQERTFISVGLTSYTGAIQQPREIFRGIPGLHSIGVSNPSHIWQWAPGSQTMVSTASHQHLVHEDISVSTCMEAKPWFVLSHSVQCHPLTATGPHSNTCSYCIAIHLACVSHILVHKEPGQC